MVAALLELKASLVMLHGRVEEGTFIGVSIIASGGDVQRAEWSFPS